MTISSAKVRRNRPKPTRDVTSRSTRPARRTRELRPKHRKHRNVPADTTVELPEQDATRVKDEEQPAPPTRHERGGSSAQYQ